ncbi:MAG: hypothetical protein EZS28_040019 [Streblomastix strix]|uniref:Uncharacterized protein n=1 Tax=Streblomastix strix TaxID=222440 RepID=A0A5J4U250_9EUKA|nr:MAG: hypothetical protein EZS28_040019 [Streblomastix strix]
MKNKTRKWVIEVKSEDVLKAGGRMKKQKKHLPPGEMIVALLEGIKERNYLDCHGKEKQELLQVQDPEIIIANFIAQLGEEKSTDSNLTNCRTAICMLFKLQGIQNEKMIGVALHQIMKKPQTAMRKERKEELLFKQDIILKYLQQQFESNRELDEQELLGCTVASITALSTLLLAEIHRASVTKEKKGAWSLRTPKYRGIGDEVSLTFRPLLIKSVCSTAWISSWLTR